MELFIREFEDYANSVGATPQAILRAAINAKWGTWASWVARKAAPTLTTVDRLREYMVANPAPSDAAPEEDAA